MLRNLRLRQAPGLACARRGARRDAALDVRCSRPASARLSCPSTCGLHVFPRVSPCLRFSLPAFFGSFSFSVPISLPVFLSCCPYSCVYLSLDQTLPRLALNSFDAVIHIIFEKVQGCRNPPPRRFLVGCCSPFMRPAEHLKALRAFVQQMSAWSVKTRRAPSRHCRDMRGSMVIRLRSCMVMSTMPPHVC